MGRHPIPPANRHALRPDRIESRKREAADIGARIDGDGRAVEIGRADRGQVGVAQIDRHLVEHQMLWRAGEMKLEADRLDR